MLMALLAFPSPRVFASASDAGSLAVVVAPVADGDSDERSKYLAQAIGSSLGLVTPHHIVDSDLSAQVLEYYNDIDAPASQDVRLAEQALAASKESFFAFRYDDAEKAIRQAISLLDAGRGDLSATGPLLVDAHITRAVIAKSRGDARAAGDALASALRVNPRLNLTAEEYPPSLVALFDEERAVLANGQAGSISVTTRPEVAEIYLNGIRQGVTPLDLTGIPAGSYQLEIRTNKYGPIRRAVDVAAGGRTEVHERLRWAKGEGPARKRDDEDAAAMVREGLRIADLMKADKAILIDADAGVGGAEKITARMVDRRLRAGQPPLVIEDARGDSPAKLAELAQALADQTAADIAKDPRNSIEPKGIADPVLLGKRKRPIHRSPIFWGIIGVVAAGAVGGGIAAAMAGGGSGGVGSVKVEFR